MTRARAITPMGTLMRKTQRQPGIHRIWAEPAKIPPNSGPSTEEMPNTARKYPWYLARSRGASMSPMIASGRDIRAPAPMPWKARNPASMIIDVEKLDSSEPTMNTPMPKM